MSDRFRLGALACLLGVIMIAHPATATDLLDASWKGDDLLMRFSDSASYTIDLAESDSSQFVIRFRNLALRPEAAVNGMNLRRGAGCNAILTPSGPNETRLTLTARQRLGYVSLWRPYSHTLVVHTFDWDRLPYAHEQYYKGLLAMEQGLDAQALELLRLAHATGETRAASVLGVYYARHGDMTLAKQYLDKPLNADDYAALAAIATRAGDTIAAATNRREFERLTSQGSTGQSAGRYEQPEGPPPPLDENPNRTGNMTPTKRQQRWLYWGGGALLVLGVLGLIIWMATRSTRKRKVEVLGTVPPKPAPVEPERETPPVATVVDPVATPIVVEKPTVEVARPIVEAEEPQAQTVPVAPAVAPEPVAPPTVVPPAPTAESRVEEPVAEPEQPASRTPRPVPTQAAELRRRIEEMREAATAQAPPQPVQVPPTTNKQTITEARKLRLSRDSVELRRRMERESDKP